MLRRKLFDSFQSLGHFQFIDLCAGTGAVGLEALSRGAAQVTAVEISRRPMIDLKYWQGLAKEMELGSFQWVTGDSLTFLKKFFVERTCEGENGFDSIVLFFDPPYPLVDLYERLKSILLSKDYRFTGRVWIESCQKKGVPSEYWDEFKWALEREFFHGDHYIICLKFDRFEAE